MVAHETVVLERHAVGVGELQVGDTVSHLGGLLCGNSKSSAVERGKPHEAAAAAHCDLDWSAIGAEELGIAVLIIGDERSEPSRQPGMARDRSVLRPGQFKPPLDLSQRHRERGAAKAVERQSGHAPFHRIRLYLGELTAP